MGWGVVQSTTNCAIIILGRGSGARYQQFSLMQKYSGVSLCSWNVNGVNNHIKRGRVLSHLKSQQADIMFLQETHLSNGRLRCKWVDQIYHSKFSIKARGMAILIRNGVAFKHLMVLGKLQSMHLTLLNIYGPNCDDSEFL